MAKSTAFISRSKKEVITFQLTAEQLEELRPVFSKCAKYPASGFCLAQVFDDGTAKASFVTFDEMLKAWSDEKRAREIKERQLEKLNQDDDIYLPAGW
jgi:hypothetical protein